MAEPTIYIGPWMDWARGWGNGMTMTLRAQHGQVLTAFLGIFVTIVGSQSWTIVSFIIHQCRAGRSLGDAQHQQIQVTLRNQGTALGAAWQLARLWIPWRTTSSLPQSLLAVGPWMLLALLHGLAWIFAGTMSSYAGKGVGNDFLIRGRTCGYWQPPQIDHQYYQLMDSKDLNDTVTAADYVRLCYDRPQDSPSCNRFVRQSIRWKGDLTNGTNCPFDSSLCRPDNHTSVTMDTGPLDSLQDFGINLRPSERIVYRRVTTCAPLRWQRDFSKMTNVTRTTGKESMTLLRFYFGPFQGANYTYQYNMDSRLTGGGYQLAVRSQTAGLPTMDWEPAPAINRTDADISLFFLSANAVVYLGQVDDPFFGAHKPTELDRGDQAYLPDRPVQMIGCADQHQFCNPNRGRDGQGRYQRCSPLTGGYVLHDVVHSGSLGFSPAQDAVSHRFLNAFPLTQIGQSVLGRGASALLASRTVSEPVQAPLPNDQWRLEVASWFNVALARLQGEIVEYATGPLSVSTEGRMFRENGTTDKAMCTQQKVRDPTGYTNFNIFGIVIMFVVGSIIIVISWVLEPLVGFLRQRFWKGSDYKRVQWLLNSTLQLQRIAFETTGLGGPWLRVGKTVPITREKHDLGEMYEYMDASDRHLRFILRKASTEDELTSPNTPRSDNTSRTMVAAMEDSRLFRLPSKI